MSAKNRISPEPADMAGKTYNMEKAAEANGTTVEEKGQYTPTKTDLTHGDANSEPLPKGMENMEDKEEEIGPMVGVGALFRFAAGKDKWLMVLGTLGAVLQGAALPLMIIVFGDMTDMFIDDALFDAWLDEHMDNITQFFPNATREIIRDSPDKLVDFLIGNNMTELADTLSDRLIGSLLADMRVYAQWYAGIGGLVLIVAYIQIACWQTASLNQSQKIRESLFRCILKQDIGWFDTHESGELNTRLSDDVGKIETGMGDKLSMVFQYVSGFITGFVIGFIYGWQLTLVILAVSPLMIASGAVMAQLGSKLTTQGLKAYAKAGGVAEEVLGSMRTVTAFGGQAKEVERYSEHLSDARDFGVKKGLINGATMGVVFLVMFCCYGLGFWYGSKLVRENDDYTGGTILIVFFSVIIAAFSIGNAGPYLQDFSKARGAAHAIWAIIDLEPHIDSSSTEGKTLKTVNGNIEFRNVKFRYPSRQEVPVLEGLNLKIDVGQTVALVGQSGCGKSTTVALIQRFYDVLEGEVLLDGVNIKELNVKWLRNQIGVVSQEPVLFGKTIRENIELGRDGVTDAEIDKATKAANAYDFIMKLPKKYNTMVGERGAQLSGGQKQRIAIARALVRDPKVLLLDEATSALDTESEAVVQAALDKASQGRTTLIIAHRLSTVRNADQIAGITNGKVVELGNHDQLMKHEGIYYTLCTNQSKNMEGLEDHVFTKTPRKDSLGSPQKQQEMDRTLSVTGKKGGDQKEVEDEEEEILPDPSLKRIMRMNAPEGVFIVFGSIAAVISGCIQPAFAIIFAEILGVFSNLDMEQQERDANMYSIIFCLIGVVAGLAMLVQSYCLSRSGEYLTMRVRQQTFKAFVRQDIAFFDDSKNTTGALCARLATDASAVEGATGARVATVLQAFSAMAAGIIIGFVFSWELTLLILAFAPFMMVSGFIEMQMYTGKNGDRQSSEEAGKIATESIENIRTVAQLTKENQFVVDYSVAIQDPYKANRKKAQVHAVAWATSQAVVFFAYAACFTLGAFLIEEGRLNYIDMFKVFSAIVFSAMSVGQATSFAPDYGKAKTSAAKIFQLLDRVPEIDSYSEAGNKPANFSGKVQLTGAEFVYPTRSTVPVLKGVDIEVPPGKVIALVGSSGCGKSTVVSLVERFYDAIGGSVKLDGHDIRELHVQYFRSKIGIVSQEPILFDASIRENIAYGDNSRQIGMDEIIKAAKNANIHSFIETLPLGYDTNVGDKGTQLSGGQKQRVAIARALVRDPKILLLDEATSALDTESEKVVQEALDKAQEGRTSIVIAHRLSTIQNADCIYVISNGEVAEQGTHTELLQQRGIYYRMNTAQHKTAA